MAYGWFIFWSLGLVVDCLEEVAAERGEEGRVPPSSMSQHSL